MSSIFGPGEVTVLRRPDPVAGSDDLIGVVAAARDPQSTGPTLLVGRCRPTAAFSRRDTLAPGCAAAMATATRHGFETVVRPVGGHLAAYDEGSYVLHLWAPHPDPRRELRQRFAVVGAAIAAGLRTLGVPDVRVGAVPGEYCDGEWSVNVAGRAKVAGTGQRLFRQGYLFCAVVSVHTPDPVREVLVHAYRDLDVPVERRSIGCITDHAPQAGMHEVGETLVAAVTAAVRTADCLRGGGRGPTGAGPRDASR